MGAASSHGLPTATRDAQAQVRSHIHYYVPRTTTHINVTERTPPAASRELAISASAYLVTPRIFQWDYIDGAVRTGYVDLLRILLDALDVVGFVPKITRTLSYAEHVSSLQIFADQLPVQAVVQCFAFPNILDSLPPRCDALTSFWLATAAHQLVHFDVIAKVLLRARNLRHLRLEGPQIAATSNKYEDYIPVKLEYLTLLFVDMQLPVFKEILVRSGRSLKSLHMEQVTNLDPHGLATVFTMIIPDARALASLNVTLVGVMDHILAEPLISCQYLYVGGLAISDDAFTRNSNLRGILISALPALQTFQLKDCRNLKVKTLSQAIREGRLPKVKRLDAIWPLVEVKPADYNELCTVCAENGITMSEDMTAHFSPYVNESTLDAEQAMQMVDEDILEAIAKLNLNNTVAKGSDEEGHDAVGSKKRRSHKIRNDRGDKDDDKRHRHKSRRSDAGSVSTHKHSERSHSSTKKGKESSRRKQKKNDSSDDEESKHKRHHKHKDR